MKYDIVRRTRTMSHEEAQRIYLGRRAPNMDPDIIDPTVVIDQQTGIPILGYLPVTPIAALRRAVLQTKMTTTYRAGNGMSNVSRTFGMAPRKPTQWREACAPTSLALESPEVTATLVDYAQVLADMMREFVPVQVRSDVSVIEQVLPEWRLSEQALWTSGVINKTSQLPYHTDKFNFDAWVAMICLRRKVGGGHLHIPEYDLTVGCRDGYAVFWSGYRLIHGVTPIHLATKEGYRYTVVYYALKGMKDCFTHAVETETARKRRTEREHVTP